MMGTMHESLPVLVTSLEGVNASQHFSSVSSSRCWVGEDESDGLLRVDDEDGANGEGDSLRINIGDVLVIQP